MDSNAIDDEIKSINVKYSLLPNKSKHLYEQTYSAYNKWCSNKNVTTSEDSILAYFNSDLSCYKSSSLWTKYSMLRLTINLHEGIDISKFPSIISFLKRKGEGYNPRRSLTLTKDHIDDFLMQADNKEHLLNKVILILGVVGACRPQELVSLTTSRVKDSQTHFLIKLVDIKSKKFRSFIVEPGDFENLNLLEVIRTYIKLRPAKTSHNRFLLNYAKEKCTVQPIGIHKVGNVPKVVAKFLHLDNSSSYTAHCFRRTSATLLAKAGVNMTGLKRHGGWRSTTVAEGYIDESENKKKQDFCIEAENSSSTVTESYIDESENNKEQDFCTEADNSSSVTDEYTDESENNKRHDASAEAENYSKTSGFTITSHQSLGVNISNNINCVININHYHK